MRGRTGSGCRSRRSRPARRCASCHRLRICWCWLRARLRPPPAASARPAPVDRHEGLLMAKIGCCMVCRCILQGAGLHVCGGTHAAMTTFFKRHAEPDQLVMVCNRGRVMLQPALQADTRPSQSPLTTPLSSAKVSTLCVAVSVALSSAVMPPVSCTAPVKYSQLPAGRV